MAIKLYKSQLEPTTKSSNVENKAFASMQEAGSIGRAFKGMVQSGEKLYIKHQDYKTDNEILEKSKEVMNGTDSYEGLSSIELKAKQMSDPDKALQYYNTEWQKIFDSVNGSLSNKMAQRKFKDFMTKQNIKDGNSIKLSATSKMIENLRANKLDEINTKVKSIIWGNELESKIATNELEAIYKDAKTVEIFGDKLDDMIRSTQRDIAFYGYKNVPLDQRDKALEEAKKDPRLQIDDVQKLITSFNVKKTSIDHKNRSNVTTMVENVKKGFPLSQADYENAVNIAINTEDQITLNKLEQLAKDANIYAQLATMSVGEIENRKNILLEFQKTKGALSLDDTNNLRITTEYLSKLTSDLNKDQLMTANERNIGVSIQDIGFEKLLTGELKPEDFTEKVKQRIGNAYAVANHYKRDVVFFTNNEKKAIQAAYQQADTPDQIIKLTTALVQSFGMESDKAFAQFSKEDSFFAHIGGLVMQTGGAGDNVKLAVEGFLLMQGEENKKIYSVKNEDRASVVDEYSSAFLMNRDTQNSTIEAANYIYAAQLKNAGKSGFDDFDTFAYEKAFKMAAGATYVAGVMGSKNFDAFYGGFDEHNDNKVYIPGWLQEGKFDDVVKTLKDHPELIDMGSTNGKAPVDINGELIDVFAGDAPYFISVGDGVYLIGVGDNPKDVTGEPEYLLNSDGGYFKLDLNKIKGDLQPYIQ